ncbi:MAG TPA: molecular chaperone TorD family protein [Steroidobacteraceae bacterium]|nr:molecular chaperone TorD family protein [Steroidobacteraceae bacterium]HQX77498.1 molecular chaperone TorD family protein [Steroidobacteraceae bacterium]HQZ78988.1 molecular chaperone TorD family protein [Steroidobacteraceae bacterium]
MGARRYVRNRDTSLTAPIRCRTYALFSALLASPHDLETGAPLCDAGWTDEVRPYGIDLAGLGSAYAGTGWRSQARDYSALFEVGDSGPPVAIREQQQFKDLPGVREELVRFYEFFGYLLSERYAWAPDHLSVILEFTHFLCYRESSARRDILSYQLAQLDFVSRHLINWTPVLVERIDAARPGSIFADIARSLHRFVVHDHEWQASTVFGSDGRCMHG